MNRFPAAAQTLVLCGVAAGTPMTLAVC